MGKTVKYDETTTMDAIRERAVEENVQAGTVVASIMTADTVLSERLAFAPVVAARCHGKHGEAAKVAREAVRAAAESKQGTKVTLDAAKQAVSRIVKVGRVLAAHPGMDPVATFTLTNRATDDQISAAVTAKDADTATDALNKKPRAKGNGGGGNVKTAAKLAEARVNGMTADRQWLAENATRDEAKAYYNALAKVMAEIASDLKSDAIRYRDERDAAIDAAADDIAEAS